MDREVADLLLPGGALCGCEMVSLRTRSHPGHPGVWRPTLSAAERAAERSPSAERESMVVVTVYVRMLLLLLLQWRMRLMGRSETCETPCPCEMATGQAKHRSPFHH